MTNDVCPHHDDLKAFAIGDLAAPSVQRIAEHIAGCSQCDAVLQQFDNHVKRVRVFVRDDLRDALNLRFSPQDWSDELVSVSQQLEDEWV